MKESEHHPHQSSWIFIVIGAALFLIVLALLFQPSPERQEPEMKSKLVETIVARKSQEPVSLFAFGTVQADREVTLKTEVPGRVISQSKNLVVGGLVSEGEVLLNLDPRDYRNIVEQEKASVERARFELEQEKGRQVVAKREWEQLSPTIKTEGISEDLALRKPHLKEKIAALAAAMSRLEKAKLDFKRTIITSPMDGIVLQENTEVGDYITPQIEIAKLAATHLFRVQASVPIDKLQWIILPNSNDQKAEVTIFQDVGGKSLAREGRIMRLLGDLDPGGRMARVLIAVEDPLLLKTNDEGLQPLLIGTYVKVKFQGPVLKDVFLIPRIALHENSRVWIKNEEGELEIRDVNVVQRRPQFVLVDSGVTEGDEIVISNLPLAIPGMRLRTVEEQP